MSAIVFTPEQESAIALIKYARFGLVTGGPGTGKTTIVSHAIADMSPDSVCLAAPTGKAARRMSEAMEKAGANVKRKAATVHRLLGYRGFEFVHNATTPLEAELVIVDESSMLDIQLAAALFNAIGRHSRLILVGDADQLPSVGPGRVFADLLQYEPIPKVRLTIPQRAHDRVAWVNRNAPRVLCGEQPELTTADDFEFVEVNAAVDIPAAVRKVVEREQDTYVLSPQRTGYAGVYRLNAELQPIRNLGVLDLPENAPCLRREHYTMHVGDWVLQTKNDYHRDVTNGEIGVIETISGTACTVRFDDERLVDYTNEQAFALELAYALTVHKSQGSEYENVVVVIHSTHTRMLTRKLLYTAITRTRGKVTIIGDQKGLDTALRTKRDDDRNTTLLERLRGELEAVEDFGSARA